MKTLLIANKHLGALVLEMLLRRGHDVTLITADAENASAIWADRLSVKTTVKPDRVPLVGEDIPAGLDLVVSAHSHRILPAWVTRRPKRGAIGYHPSLLPAFKGRAAIADALARWGSLHGWDGLPPHKRAGRGRNCHGPQRATAKAGAGDLGRGPHPDLAAGFAALGAGVAHRSGGNFRGGLNAPSIPLQPKNWLL